MLHQEQSYIFEIARETGIGVKLIHHQRPTISCAEKLDLLKENPDFEDWTLDRIVKALYFSRNSQPFIGVITPEFERNIKPKEIFPRVISMSKRNAERYWINPNNVPEGMSWGTCTPFPLVSSAEKEIGYLIFLDHPPIKNKLVDISVGGTGKEAYEFSMHLPYWAIYEILKKQFGDKIHILS